MSIKVFGHINPDTDSITAAIVHAYLLNQTGQKAKPYRLGEIQKDTAFVLRYFGVSEPELLEDVRVQIRDIEYDHPRGVLPEQSLLAAYRKMEQESIKTLPVIDSDKQLVGIVTMKDIAMSLIHGEMDSLNTSINNLLIDLDADVLSGKLREIRGRVGILTYEEETIYRSKLLSQYEVLVVGDRYRLMEAAIVARPVCLIVTGGAVIPKNLVDLAEEHAVNLLVTPYDTYRTSTILHQSNSVGAIMKAKHIMRFTEADFMDDFSETLRHSKHSNFPVVSADGRYKGMLSRKHLFNPGRKRVVLVDHNEYEQSVLGIEQAEIVMIVDHHKIGNISTMKPIHFRNMTVGSTNTILYQMYQEQRIEPPKWVLGLMISGIISDTLMLQSPTTTALDIETVEAINESLHLNLEEFSHEMFLAASQLMGDDPGEVLAQDYKEFLCDIGRFGVSQVFTLDDEGIQKNRDALLQALDIKAKERDLVLAILMVTDISKRGSYMYYSKQAQETFEGIFEVAEQGEFFNQVVSRKQQVIPRILQAIHLI